MLLGQIVAISFAQSLFFIAASLFPSDAAATSTNKKKGRARRETSSGLYNITCSIWYMTVIAMVFFPVAMIPAWIHTPRFLSLLAIPHIALMLLPIAETFLFPLSSSGPCGAPSRRAINLHNGTIAVLGGLLQMRTVMAALKDTSLNKHLHCHSAVFSNPVLNLSYRSLFTPQVWDLVTSLYDHPASTSVGWDVLLCSVNYLIWRYVRPKG